MSAWSPLPAPAVLYVCVCVCVFACARILLCHFPLQDLGAYQEGSCANTDWYVVAGAAEGALSSHAAPPCLPVIDSEGQRGEAPPGYSASSSALLVCSVLWDRPHASQVSFSLRDRGRLSFLKINATIFATHRIFCKLILALSHSLKSRRALDGFDKSTVVDMAPGQFGFLPLAHWLSGRSLWDLSYPAVRSPSHTERPSIGTPLGLTPPLSSQLMAAPSAI